MSIAGFGRILNANLNDIVIYWQVNLILRQFKGEIVKESCQYFASSFKQSSQRPLINPNWENALIQIKSSTERRLDLSRRTCQPGRRPRRWPTCAGCEPGWWVAASGPQQEDFCLLIKNPGVTSCDTKKSDIDLWFIIQWYSTVSLWTRQEATLDISKASNRS